MISVDITVLFHIINMLVLMAVLNRILYKPVIAMMDKRHETLDSLSGEAEQFGQHARARQAELDRKLHEASVKAKKTLEAARGDAERAGAERLAAIRAEAGREKEQQLAEIQASFDIARSELLGNINSVAQDMAAKIMGRSVQA